MPDAAESPSSSAAPGVRALRLALAAVITVSAGWLLVDRARHREWPDHEVRRSAAASTTSERVERALRADGVRVDGHVRAALRALVNEWNDRPDLQKQFVTDDGLPDLEGLLSWVGTRPNTAVYRLMTYRGALDELSNRMAILPANGDIDPVLAWTLRNRAEPLQDATDALLRVSEAWRARPDVRERFTVDGRVRVRQLLFWAATVPPGDPSYASFVPVAPQLAALTAEYSGPKS